MSKAYFRLVFIFFFSTNLTAQSILNIHLNNGKVIQRRVGYMNNNVTVTFGSASWLNDNLNYGSLTDQDGNVYKTIQIGNQEWMAENLRAVTFTNGDSLSNWFKYTSQVAIADSIPAWFYNPDKHDNEYETPYGKLYTKWTITDQRNICPTGWHVPTAQDWSILINYLGGSQNAPAQLSTAGSQFWSLYYLTIPFPASNSSGFSAIPIYYPGNLQANRAGFYASTTVTTPSGKNLIFYEWSPEYLNQYQTDLDEITNASIGFGAAIRCIKD